MVNINDGLPPAKPEQAPTENKPKGQSYRLALRAVLEATGHDDYDVAIAVPNHAVAMQIMHLIRSITNPIADFAKMRWLNHIMVFNNQSEIRVHVAGVPFDGLRVNLLLVDESWYRLVTDNYEHDWLKKLRQQEQPNSVQKPLDTGTGA